MPRKDVRDRVTRALHALCPCVLHCTDEEEHLPEGRVILLSGWKDGAGGHLFPVLAIGIPSKTGPGAPGEPVSVRVESKGLAYKMRLSFPKKDDYWDLLAVCMREGFLPTFTLGDLLPKEMRVPRFTGTTTDGRDVTDLERLVEKATRRVQPVILLEGSDGDTREVKTTSQPHDAKDTRAVSGKRLPPKAPRRLSNRSVTFQHSEDDASQADRLLTPADSSVTTERRTDELLHELKQGVVGRKRPRPEFDSSSESSVDEYDTNALEDAVAICNSMHSYTESAPFVPVNFVDHHFADVMNVFSQVVRYTKPFTKQPDKQISMLVGMIVSAAELVKNGALARRNGLFTIAFIMVCRVVLFASEREGYAAEIGKVCSEDLLDAMRSYVKFQ
jgi:hypothetical protein